MGAKYCVNHILPQIYFIDPSIKLKLDRWPLNAAQESLSRHTHTQGVPWSSVKPLDHGSERITHPVTKSLIRLKAYMTTHIRIPIDPFNGNG